MQYILILLDWCIMARDKELRVRFSERELEFIAKASRYLGVTSSQFTRDRLLEFSKNIILLSEGAIKPDVLHKLDQARTKEIIALKK